LRVPVEVVERDYAIGHVLAGVYGCQELAESLVFKGGTALKKAYFGE
jgi:predicted nucleotidyltransferase component of viral defense system